MSTFHERFVQAFDAEVARRRKNNEPRLTKTMVWKAANSSSAAFSHWYGGANGMDLDTCVLVSPILRVNPTWLFYGTGKKDLLPSSNTKLHADGAESEPSNLEQAPALRGKVPLISWVQAGDWQDVIDNLSPGEGELIETTYNAKRHTYALRVKGDSMEPRFPEGSILIVEPDEPATHGKFVIVRQNGNGEATFKQLIQDGGRYYLKPLNSRYPIMELQDDAAICGVVKRVEMDV